jgi:polyisoprenoid-binding protein YceI
MMKKLIIAVATVFLWFPVYSQQIVTDASEITFKVKSSGGLGITDGKFKGPQGDIVFNPSDLENSYFDVKVDVSTINTGVNLRDNHLKSDDFFYVEKFPHIAFESISIEKTSDGYLTTGTLQIKGIEMPQQIPFNVKRYDDRLELSGEFMVERKKFDVGTNFGRFFIGNEVKVNVETVLSY